MPWERYTFVYFRTTDAEDARSKQAWLSQPNNLQPRRMYVRNMHTRGKQDDGVLHVLQAVPMARDTEGHSTWEKSASLCGSGNSSQDASFRVVFHSQLGLEGDISETSRLGEIASTMATISEDIPRWPLAQHCTPLTDGHERACSIWLIWPRSYHSVQSGLPKAEHVVTW